MTSWAAIFDWDGVVIDSSAQHEESWDLLAAESGRKLPLGHFKAGFGRKNQIIIPEILGWATDPAEIERIANRKEELYRELVARDGVTVLPGARQLLASLSQAGVPCAVGSSTPRENLEAIFAATGLGGHFGAVISGDDVNEGKPAPEVFLKAADKLGFAPARCVVFEDALAGIEAAQRGGMKVVGVATTNPPKILQHADRVVNSLAEISREELASLMRT